MITISEFESELAALRGTFGDSFLGIELLWGVIPEATLLFTQIVGARIHFVSVYPDIIPAICANFRVCFELVDLETLDL